MTDLVGLARRYVALSDELESIRGEIAKAVLNGGDPSAPFVNAQRRGGKASQGSRSQLQSRQELQPSQPNHIEAAKLAEEKILSLLRERPRRMAEISSEMQARQSTTSERLRRMRDKGLVKRDGEGWAVSA